MTVYENVKSDIRPQEVTIKGNKVYIASNIQSQSRTMDNHSLMEFNYTCTVYDKDEYLIKLAQENAQLQQELLDTQLALVELYEGGGL